MSIVNVKRWVFHVEIQLIYREDVLKGIVCKLNTKKLLEGEQGSCVRNQVLSP